MPQREIHLESRFPEPNPSGLPPVLLVHGAWHGAWCWEQNFLDYFAEHGFETHAIDLRGHGKSPPLSAMRWNRISGYVDDVADIVENLDQPPFVIGHSMGGFVCQHLLDRTENLSGVGLLATVPHYGAYRVTAKIAATRPIDFLKVNLFWSLYPLVRDPVAAKHMFLDTDASEETQNEFAARLIDESYLGFLDMLFLNLPKAREKDIPILVVGGEKDTLFPPDTQQATAQKYRADCKIIPDAPHNVMLSKHWNIAAEAYKNWMREVLAQTGN